MIIPSNEVYNAVRTKPPGSLISDDVLLIYSDGCTISIGNWDYIGESWRDISGHRIAETEKWYIAGWTNLPEVEDPCKNLADDYEWGKAHDNDRNNSLTDI